MAAGVRVVADISDPLRVEHIAGDLEDALAHLLRNPGIDSVGDDEVERSKPLQAWVAKVHRFQSYICQSQISDQRPTRRNGDPAEINPNKLAFWQLKCHRHQIACSATSQFQHPAVLD